MFAPKTNFHVFAPKNIFEMFESTYMFQVLSASISHWWGQAGGNGLLTNQPLLLARTKDVEFCVPSSKDVHHKLK